MFKTRYSLLLIIILFALSACHSLWTAQTRPVPQPDSILILPTTDVPLPATDLAFLFPEEPELQQQTSPRKNITENFSAREKSDIAVPLFFSFDRNRHPALAEMISAGLSLPEEGERNSKRTS